MPDGRGHAADLTVAALGQHEGDPAVRHRFAEPDRRHPGRQCGFGFHEAPRPPSSLQLATAWRPYVEACIDAFGAGRCMFESNFPVDQLSCSYLVLWNAFKRIAAGCSAQEKASLFSDTASRVYRLDRIPGATAA